MSVPDRRLKTKKKRNLDLRTKSDRPGSQPFSSADGIGKTRNSAEQQPHSRHSAVTRCASSSFVVLRTVVECAETNTKNKTSKTGTRKHDIYVLAQHARRSGQAPQWTKWCLAQNTLQLSSAFSLSDVPGFGHVSVVLRKSRGCHHEKSFSVSSRRTWCRSVSRWTALKRSLIRFLVRCGVETEIDTTNSKLNSVLLFQRSTTCSRHAQFEGFR